jgi:menaquinone-specific isochorismate synthase
VTQGVQLHSDTLEQQAINAPEGDLWVSLSAPMVGVEQLMNRPEASFAWSSPADASFLGDPVAPPDGARLCVGLGVARRFSADGGGRFLEIEREAGSVLAGIQQLAEAGRGPKPRVFGGFAFVAGGCSEPPWRGFCDAQFFLPRVLYARTAEGATLSAFVPAEQRGRVSSRLRELRRLAVELQDAELPAPGQPSVADHPQSIRAGQWAALVESILEGIARGEYEKVVPARRSTLEFATPISVAATLRALQESHPSSTRFAFRTETATFLGATPERLVLRRGHRVLSEALAGTFNRSEQPIAELRNPKEDEEHQAVVRAVVATLRPFCSELSHPEEPQLRQLKHLLHLHTPIRGQLRQTDHVLRLVQALHPTPAVGGVPTGAAVDWIERNEIHERGWYAGPVGWFDANGDGDFSVALRCGVLTEERAYLYAGAGIVRGSAPLQEYAETELKFRTLLGALRTEGG